MISDLVLKNRSYRRFDPTCRVSREVLTELVDLARLCPSGRNLQALKFMIVEDFESCELLFPCLSWAGYLSDWDGPVDQEHPAAYIVVLGDRNLGSRFEIDLGICAQTILLGAVEKGLGGCMIASIRQDSLRRQFSIPDNMEILMVLALGKPVETVVIEPVENGNIRYWRDQEQIHHVPKRGIDEILLLPEML
jgi:nitroreductase